MTGHARCMLWQGNRPYFTLAEAFLLKTALHSLQCCLACNRDYVFVCQESVIGRYKHAEVA